MRTLFAFASIVCCAGLQAQVAVVNGASFRPEQAVTNGSWASAFGNFAGVTATTAPGFPVPKTLGGVVVNVAGIDAPVYYVSTTVINFLVPYAAPAGVQPIQVRTAAGNVSGTMRIVPSGPGLFIKDSTQQQPPKGAVLNQNSAENTSTATARRGEVIQIYATGPGALTAPAEDGVAPPSSPLIGTRSAVQVYIAGVQAVVQFSGLAPGLPGVWQVNATLPDRPFITGRVPVRVFVDGVDSNEVTIFVAQ